MPGPKATFLMCILLLLLLSLWGRGLCQLSGLSSCSPRRASLSSRVPGRPFRYARNWKEIWGEVKALHTHREGLCMHWGPPPRGKSLCQERWEGDKELNAHQGLRHFPAGATPQITHGAASPHPSCLSLPVPLPARPCQQDGIPSQGKGYNHVEGQDAQAAHEPGQVVQDVVTLALARLRVLQEDTEAVQGIPQHHQGKEEVGDPTGGFPLVLGKEGEERSLAAALLNLCTK